MNRDALGKEYPPTETVISAGAIRRVAAAVDHHDAIHHDEQAAKRAGFRSIVAPVGGLVAGAAGSQRGADIHQTGPLADLGIDFSKALFGGIEVEYQDVVCAGDVLVASGRISDIYEKVGASGTMTFAVVETTYTTKSGEPVMTSRMTFLERG